jgi:hypothetical protein
MGVPQMSRKVLFRLTLILAFITLSLPAFSQAIAESVLLGAGSSTATVTPGSALNSALNQRGKQLAGRVQQKVSRPPQARTSQTGRNLLPKSRAGGTASRKAPQPGELIVSIQGAELSSPRTDKPAYRGRNKTTLESAASNSTSNKTSAEEATQKYKSVVTVSIPK